MGANNKICPNCGRKMKQQVHTKNKNKKKYLREVYPNESYKIPKTPDELEYRIENAKEQKIKSYDFFL